MAVLNPGGGVVSKDSSKPSAVAEAGTGTDQHPVDEHGTAEAKTESKENGRMQSDIKALQEVKPDQDKAQRPNMSENEAQESAGAKPLPEEVKGTSVDVPGAEKAPTGRDEKKAATSPVQAQDKPQEKRREPEAAVKMSEKTEVRAEEEKKAPADGKAEDAAVPQAPKEAEAQKKSEAGPEERKQLPAAKSPPAAGELQVLMEAHEAAEVKGAEKSAGEEAKMRIPADIPAKVEERMVVESEESKSNQEENKVAVPAPEIPSAKQPDLVPAQNEANREEKKPAANSAAHEPKMEPEIAGKVQPAIAGIAGGSSDEEKKAAQTAAQASVPKKSQEPEDKIEKPVADGPTVKGQVDLAIKSEVPAHPKSGEKAEEEEAKNAIVPIVSEEKKHDDHIVEGPPQNAEEEEGHNQVKESAACERNTDEEEEEKENDSEDPQHSSAPESGDNGQEREADKNAGISSACGFNHAADEKGSKPALEKKNTTDSSKAHASVRESQALTQAMELEQISLPARKKAPQPDWRKLPGLVCSLRTTKVSSAFSQFRQAFSEEMRAVFMADIQSFRGILMPHLW